MRIRTIIILMSSFCFAFSSYANEKYITVRMIAGTIEIQSGDKKIIPEKNLKIPENSVIKVGEKSKLEIEMDEEIYSITGPIEINLAEVPTWKHILKERTVASGVRMLNENILTQTETRSENFFEEYVKQQGGHKKDYKKWNNIADTVFARLSDAYGKELSHMRYAIVENNNFNMKVFSGGQIVIHSSFLDFIDSESFKKFPKDPKKKSEFKENILAAAISHEFSHFSNLHIQKTQKKYLNSEPIKQEENEYISQAFSQSMEANADTSGFLLMEIADYPAYSMVTYLEILDSYQKSNPDISYFNIHPGVSERAKNLEKIKKELHDWSEKTEIILINIRLGIKLEEAKSELDASLEKEEWKDNILLQEARIVCMHKLWLKTIPLKDQKLKIILDLPSYRDNLKISEKETLKKEDNIIPGDQKKYFELKEYYENLILQTVNPALISDYATLLADYANPNDASETNRERKKAVKLAELCVFLGTVRSFNNLAFVYYKSGRKEEALNLLRQLTSQIHEKDPYKKITSFLPPSVRKHFTSEEYKDRIKFSIDPIFSTDTFTPLLNLAIAEYSDGERDDAKQYAKAYFTFYDNDSSYAKYLSDLTDVPIDVSEKKLNQKDMDKLKSRLKPGLDESELEKLLGKTYKIRGYYRIYTIDKNHSLYIPMYGNIIGKPIFSKKNK